jgi:hypothetical protein
VRFCLEQSALCASRLPDSGEKYSPVKPALPTYAIEDESSLGQSFRDHLNDLQLVLMGVHKRIAGNWFL